MPVAYVLVPPGATAKALAGQFARHLGIPIAGRMTQARITFGAGGGAGVEPVVNQNQARPDVAVGVGDRVPADLLKDLTERIPATFVYVGIDVTAAALFSGVRGAQLAGRASLVACGAFPARLGTREPFTELTAGVEAALDLQAHRPGTLPRLAGYLHQRTGGRIGSLTPLFRHAAINAIDNGTEHITRASLDRIRLDHPAETHHTPAASRTRTSNR